MEIDAIQTNNLEVGGSTINNFQNILTNNYVINGNFDFWQRGTSISGPLGVTYLADRWALTDGADGTASASRQSFTLGQTEVPGKPKYFLRYVMSSGATGGSATINQRFEDVASYSSKTLTLSFWAKVSSGTLTFTPTFLQYFGSGGSESVDTENPDITVNTSWAYYTSTFTIPSVSGKTITSNDYLSLRFLFPYSTTFTFDLAQVKVEDGESATPFVARPIQQELALCQRYYEKSYELNVDPGTIDSAGSCIIRQPVDTIALSEFSDRFAVEKRATPTITWYSPTTGNSGYIRNYSGSSDIAITGTFSTYPPSTKSPGGAYHAATGTANQLKVGHWTADAEL